MRKLLIILFLSIAPMFCYSQNQQGFIYVLDLTENGEVYYMSPFLECSFDGDHDSIDAQRKRLDEQYKKYITDNYTLVNFQTVHSDWMEPGRGVFPERTYNNKIKNLPIMREGSDLIIVSDFKIDCGE